MSPRAAPAKLLRRRRLSFRVLPVNAASGLSGGARVGASGCAASRRRSPTKGGRDGHHDRALHASSGSLAAGGGRRVRPPCPRSRARRAQPRDRRPRSPSLLRARWLRVLVDGLGVLSCGGAAGPSGAAGPHALRVGRRSPGLVGRRVPRPGAPRGVRPRDERPHPPRVGFAGSPRQARAPRARSLQGAPLVQQALPSPPPHRGQDRPHAAGRPSLRSGAGLEVLPRHPPPARGVRGGPRLSLLRRVPRVAHEPEVRLHQRIAGACLRRDRRGAPPSRPQRRPELVCAGARSPERAFCPADDVPEDPQSGAATCAPWGEKPAQRRA